jgi:hypothetical protein
MKLERDALKESVNELLKSVTSPEFLAQLEDVRRIPRERRIDEATKRLTPSAMRQAGIKLPDGIRISSRYFEEGDDFTIELGDVTDRIPVVPAINEIQPGFLDKLRMERPDLFRQLVGQPYWNGGTLSWSACACVGAGVCVGIGGGP